MNACLLVPHYNHLAQFREFLPALEATGLPLIVVDDGSTAVQRTGLRELLAQRPAASLIEMPANVGKGCAVIQGMHGALAQGFTHAVQIDADGQHDCRSVPAMLEMSQQYPTAIVSALPQFDESIPPVRYWGRKITLYLSQFESMSRQIEDAMCGFRVYPLREMVAVEGQHSLGKGMDFDAEILVKSVWAGVDIKYVASPVVYIANGVSHFRYLQDNWLMVLMHTRLIVGALLRYPGRLLGFARAAVAR